MDRVIFCVFSATDEEVYNTIVPSVFPPSEEDLMAAQEEEEAADDEAERTGRSG